MGSSRIPIMSVGVLCTVSLFCFSRSAVCQSPPTAQHVQAVHVLGRIGYGAHPADLAAIRSGAITVQQWITAQLAAAATVPPAITTWSIYLAPAATTEPTLPTSHGWDSVHLAYQRILMATFNPNQLQERMANFWRTLFNTQHAEIEMFYDATQPSVIAAEVATHVQWKEFVDFRTHALGTFKNIVLTSLNSAGMRIYLDADSNTSTDAPNENLAREFLELHTLGPTNTAGVALYSQDDVRNLARSFVGMSAQGMPPGLGQIVDSWPPQALPSFTLFAGSSIAPLVVPAGPNSAAKLTMIIDHIVSRPETAQYICSRIARHFLGDFDPLAPPGVLTAMTQAWGMDGNITAVLTALFNSTEFLNPGLTQDYRRNIVKSPFEGEVSQMRTTGVVLPQPTLPIDPVNPFNSDPTTLSMWLGLLGRHIRLASMGQELFEFPSPDGYPEASSLQVGSSRSRLRWESVWQLTSGEVLAGDNFAFVSNLMNDDTSDPLAIVFTVMDHLYPLDYVVQDAFGAYEILSRKAIGDGGYDPWPQMPGGGPFDDSQQNRIRFMMQYVMGLTQAYVK